MSEGILEMHNFKTGEDEPVRRPLHMWSEDDFIPYVPRYLGADSDDKAEPAIGVYKEHLALGDSPLVAYGKALHRSLGRRYPDE